MPIRMVFDPQGDQQAGGGIWCPVIVCDACGTAIAEARAGVFVWQMHHMEPSQPSEVLFAHTGACHETLDGRLQVPDVRLGWEQLEHFPLWVASTLGVAPGAVLGREDGSAKRRRGK